MAEQNASIPWVPSKSASAVTYVDVSIGVDGSVWGVGADGNLYHETKGVITQLPTPLVKGKITSVSNDPEGNPWVTTDDHTLYGSF